MHNAKHNKDNYNIKFKGNLKYDYVPLTDIAGRFYIASDGEIQYKNTIIKIKEKAIFINGTRLQDEIASLLIHDNGEIILDAFLKQ